MKWLKEHFPIAKEVHFKKQPGGGKHFVGWFDTIFFKKHILGE